MNLVLCFSGGIASGKTTLARAVSEERGWSYASFGAYVRDVARSRHLSEDRASLQHLGAALIEELGWPGFCDAVIGAAGWKPGQALVVDGVRHVTAFETIKRNVAPAETQLVFLDVPQIVRQGRSGEAALLASVEQHSTERDVHGALRELAHVVLDGTKDHRVLVEEVLCQFSERS